MTTYYYFLFLICLLQLAVIATYNEVNTLESDITAIFHYCCSLLVKQPFLPGYDNLSVFYEKHLSRQSRRRPLIGNTGSGSSGMGSRIPPASPMNTLNNSNTSTTDAKKSSLQYFIRIQNILFELVHECVHLSTTSSQPNIAVEAIPNEVEVLLNDASELEVQFLEDFEKVLTSSASFSDALLLKLFTICCFPLHLLTERPQEVGVTGNAPMLPESESSAKNRIQQYALKFLFNFITR